MEIKDWITPIVSLITIVVTILVYSRNNKEARKKEFAELRASMDKDKQEEIDKIRTEAAEAARIQDMFEKQAHEIYEQSHQIMSIQNDLKNNRAIQDEVRVQLQVITASLNQILQELALLKQSAKYKSKGVLE